MLTENAENKLFYYVTYPILLLASLLWLLNTLVSVSEWFLIRNLGFLCLLMTLALLFIQTVKYRKQAILICYLIFGLTRISPIEVSVKNYSGSPHWVYLIAGEPSEKGIKMIRNGEAMLGNCTVSGYEPKWVFVW